jgi:hypothetical protein
MRLIDADALNLDYEVDMADDWKTAHEMANIVKYAPTIDAVPVRHGKWVIEDGHVCCSECGEISKEYNYCPYCGARMDADE